MAESFGEKTEAPTPKRKQKARDDGDVLKSREFAAALGVLLGCGWIALLGPGLLGACKAVMAASFTFGRGDIEAFEPWRPLAEAGWKLAPSLGALLALSLAGAVLSQGALGALSWNNKLLMPKGSRINPASGLKRIFGANGWIELGKSLLKVVLLAAIGGWMLWLVARPSVGLVSSDVHQAVGALGGHFLMLLFAMSAGLAIIAGIDLPIQIVRRLQKLKMSKQEVKDEHKDSEGSPENKAAQRQRQREILKGGFRKSVGTAHVVLTNPTHFAVALRYDQGSDQVPVVVAKGRGQTALAIRELAGEFQVPVLEYPQLARAVYYTSREGQEVRDDLYMAIATVLAFVFNLNAAAGGRKPPVSVPETARFDENGRPETRRP
ncbi:MULTISPECIES: EscU/YscU/HrcU family type III secretion system export apparatus switch protein [unclassified Sphingosinithalassobacter]|uniref:EscU/YscU/HrcU family type III secretion system export apparatus switch protein n=1 Tax=unclassified Sphingosinithalassobacter TaxID=2676235 RepID=UPI00165D4151|nr:flagellar type III secretion system protein FlhB [Sphingosinithalassobacter sp. CS137]